MGGTISIAIGYVICFILIPILLFVIVWQLNTILKELKKINNKE